LTAVQICIPFFALKHKRLVAAQYVIVKMSEPSCNDDNNSYLFGEVDSPGTKINYTDNPPIRSKNFFTDPSTRIISEGRF
jgi:hypothetical protein